MTDLFSRSSVAIAPDPSGLVWLVGDLLTLPDPAWRALEERFRVDVLPSLADALARLTDDAGEPDVLVLDASREEIETIRDVRSSRDDTALSILLVLTQDPRAQLRAALDAGASDCIRRPFDADELLTRVSALARLKRLAQRARAAEQALADAREVGRVLGASLDVQSTLDALMRLVVPARADWSAVFLEGEDDVIDIAAAAHVEPEKVELMRAVQRLYPISDDGPCGYLELIRSGRPELIAMTDEHWRAAARDPAHLEMLRAIGAESLIFVPVTAHNRVLGALFLTMVGTERRYDLPDLPWAEELARRVGVALDNARLFEMTQRERRRAEEANRAKDEFLSVASHELRTPLNAIVGWTQMLQRGIAGEKRQHALDTIERNARAQVQLIEDMLDVSRIITGKLRLDVKVVDLADVVDASIDVVRASIEAKEIELTRDIDGAEALVRGDAGRLQQIAWNLLSNAVKFTPKRGHVEVRLRRVDSHVELAVEDTGRGIDPKFLPHVFEPFRQADASTTRTAGGLGLGLAIVKHLVELHGGQIEAQSDGHGRGATFTVQIPIAAPRAPSDRPPPEAIAQASASSARKELPSLDGLRILVVDDEADARELLQSLLEAARAEVIAAGTAREALALFLQRPPDVLVSDIGMPDEDGYSLIRRVRELLPSAGGRTPSIALTAYARIDDRTRALMEGFTCYLSKPVEPEELVATIAAVMGRAAQDT